MTVTVDYKKCCWKDGKCTSCSCKGKCFGCAEVCPVKAITRKSKLIIDASRCIDCGACISACKHGALFFGKKQ